MKTLYLRFCLLGLLILVSRMQTPQLIVNDQNSIEPTVVTPSTETHHQLKTDNSEPVVNSNVQTNNNNGQSIQPVATPTVQQHPQIQTQNQQPPQQGVLLPNDNMNGMEAQAIPIDQAQINEIVNQQKPTNQQSLAKAKQQAERARQMAQQARRNAQMDRRARDEQQDQELRKIQFDETLSKTERKKQQQRLLFRKASRNVEPGTIFTEYLFQQGNGAQQFFIRIPVAQQVAINLYTYVAQDNTYVRTKNIQEEQPVIIYIFENNHKIVYQGEFYYQNYILFQGQASAMYLIRVINNGRTKLISMSIKKLIEEGHLDDSTHRSVAQHLQKAQNLAIDINRWHQEFRKIRMIDFQDLKAIQGYIEKYYTWQLIQTFVAIVLCIFQVKMIQNLLKGSSIV